MKSNQKGNIGIVILIGIAIVFIGAIIYFAYYSVHPINSPSPTPDVSATIIPTVFDANETPQPSPDIPYISAPNRNSTITSPVTVKGTVPAGWMFEGVFPIKITDKESGVLSQGQAHEVTPGSWQSGESVEFEATITFPSRAAGKGSIVLENDNPSGLPENSKSFNIPIIFE